jgi:hypothetical protein
MEAFISDNYKVTPWLTVLGGLRQSHFQSAITDNYTAPRAGLAVEIPKLHWVFRGFYGRFLSGPAANQRRRTAAELCQCEQHLHSAAARRVGRGAPVRRAGPLARLVVDADTFQTRVNNFLDHSNIGDSSIYLPVTTQERWCRRGS